MPILSVRTARRACPSCVASSGDGLAIGAIRASRTWQRSQPCIAPVETSTLKIEDQLEFGSLFERDVAGFCNLKNFVQRVVEIS